ncbi:GNAT family N-acetyltransferase [Candidatus Bathyarchaeota archaeon]|nr:GNAT family N-acetyltransferase [Candidatus Bathyarchaeota archaeon]
MKTGMIVRNFVAKDGSNVILRTPRWEGLNDLLEFISSLVDEGAGITMNKKPSRQEEAEWLGRLLINLENDRLFDLVAEVDGKVVANSELSRKTGYTEHVGEIGIAIKAGYRDIGIGTEMLRTLIAHGRAIGLKVLSLSVFSTNKTAKHVYEKVGFNETGRIPKAIFKDGKYIDMVLMTMELS